MFLPTFRNFKPCFLGVKRNHREKEIKEQKDKKWNEIISEKATCFQIATNLSNQMALMLGDAYAFKLNFASCTTPLGMV